MSKVSWLHISDLHITRPSELKEAAEYNQQEILDRFLDFFKDQYPEKHIQLPQFVLITGDLAFSGTHNDYQGAGNLSVINFIQKLGDVLGHNKNEFARRVFPVAGNHDICRDDLLLKEEEQIRYDWAENPDKVTMLLSSSMDNWKRARENTVKRLNNYFDFYKKLKGKDSLSIEDALWYMESPPLDFNGKDINIIGTCSSWLCGSYWASQMKGGAIEKKPERADYLTLGESKIKRLLTPLDPSDLNIVLMHHDYELTSDRNNNVIKPLLHKKCNFILCGHEHIDTCARPIDGISHKLRAGCLYLNKKYRNCFFLTEIENNEVKVMTVEYRIRSNEWVVDKNADLTDSSKELGYKFNKKTGLLTFPLISKKNEEPVPIAVIRDSKSNIKVPKTKNVKSAKAEKHKKAVGFSIRCPYCQNWRDWQVPIDNYVVTENEFNTINNELSMKEGSDSPKMLRCKCPEWKCPAPFEALVFNDESLALKCLARIESNWSLRRDFRLYQSDHETRWEGYFGIIFCTKPVKRQRFITLEHLIERKALSRLLSGITKIINGPATIYAARVFNEEVYWMPIEGDIDDYKGSTPAFFKLICRKCRRFVNESLVSDFIRKDASPQNCALGLGDANRGTCDGKEAACAKGDWSHCPDFIDQRIGKCPCYNSDYHLIENDLTNAWKGENLSSGQGVSGYCHLGLKEFAFPIVVHNHLIGAALTGQIIEDPKKIKDINDFVKDWVLLGEKKDELEMAKNEMLKTISDGSDQNEIITERASLGAHLGLIKEIAETRYYDIRTRSESAFQEELLSYVRTKKNGKLFFKDTFIHLLERMKAFWSFRTVAFMHHSFEKKTVKVTHLATENIEPTTYGFPGFMVGTIKEKYRQEYVLPFYYDTENVEIPINPWAQKFLPLIDSSCKKMNLPSGRCYFTVCMMINPKNAVAFVFAVRDPKGVCKTKARNQGTLSQPAQEFILKTCTEILTNMKIKGFFQKKIIAP